MIGGRRPLKGRKPADRRVRVERPHSAFFRYGGPGTLVAKPAANQPKTGLGRAWARVRGVAIGRPLASEEEAGEKLSKKKALAIFSSDAISSSAYATQEIIRVLAVAGATALAFSVGVSVAIAVLLAVVSISYRQVCRAYPGGGGAYAVAKENLSPLFGLIAAAALLIDYVMTVAVSTASAIGQIVSVVPELNPVKIEIAIGVITLITIANLRGLRESGNIFAIPTYSFVFLALLMVGMGLIDIATGAAHPIVTPNAEPLGAGELSIFLLLKAFAGGSVALTGVEAIANGVPAFKPPAAKNAANTMTAMAILLGILFIGITVVAHAYAILPTVGDIPTTVSLVAASVFGAGTLLFVLFQAATALILFLAANTSFNAFPRLGGDPRPRRLHAPPVRVPRRPARLLLGHRDPRRGRRVPDLALQRQRDRPDPALLGRGVRVLHAQPDRDGQPLAAGPRVRLGLAGGGQRVRRRPDGGRPRRRRQRQVRRRRVPRRDPDPDPRRDDAVHPPPVPGVAARARDPAATSWPRHRSARSGSSSRCRASTGRSSRPSRSGGRSPTTSGRSSSPTSPTTSPRCRRRWERQLPGVPLVVVESPYRALVGPLSAYLDVLDAAWPPGKIEPITFVIIPEYVARRWWERILYNQSVKRLRSSLLGRPHTVVVNVPYRREDAEAFAKPAPPPPTA